MDQKKGLGDIDDVLYEAISLNNKREITQMVLLVLHNYMMSVSGQLPKFS